MAKGILRGISVENARKVADYLGTKIEDVSASSTHGFESDLLKNEGAKSFIEKYKQYFTATDKELLREFYEKTGLILMIVFERDEPNPFASEYLTMYGFIKPDKDPYNCHLVAHVVTDSPMAPDEKDFYEHDYDKDEHWGFSNEDLEKMHEQGHKAFDEVEYEKKCHFGPRRDFVGAFGEHFVLKNGDLYRDERKIEENVWTVFWLNDNTKIIIFKDNHMEYLEYDFREIDNCIQCNKIVYGRYFISYLIDKNLVIIIMDDDDENTSYAFGYSNVDDIQFVPYENEGINDGVLKMIVGDSYIETPIRHTPYIRDYCE